MGDFSWTRVLTSAVTLFFVMDPLGNASIFNTLLKNHDEGKRTRIILRELCFALVVLLLFLVAGTKVLAFLGLSQPSLSLSGGILLFIIALRIIFPQRSDQPDDGIQDTLIVPMAVPLIAGPSAVAIVLLLSSSTGNLLEGAAAVAAAWLASVPILAVSPRIARRLGETGMRAVERLTGMLLVMIATQMFLNGLSQYIRETFLTTQ